MRNRAAEPAAGNARGAAWQAQRIRQALARETKAEKILWSVGAAIPAVFPAGFTLAGKHRRGLALHYGAPPGQCRAPARLRPLEGQWPPISQPRARDVE